jgi:hypothetical protein
MRTRIVVLAGSVCFALFATGALAQSNVNSTESSSIQGWKDELSSDKQQLQQQKESIKAGAEDAKAQEKALREQIRTAVESGDQATAQKLREQLQGLHQANVDQKQQDTQTIKGMRDEMTEDRKAAREKPKNFKGRGRR